MTNEISKEKLMTTKEVASVLGVSDRTIREHARKLGLTQNGKQTFLDEKTVTVIKKQLEMSSQIDVERSFQLPKTMLEKQILINQALQLSSQ